MVVELPFDWDKKTIVNKIVCTYVIKCQERQYKIPVFLKYLLKNYQTFSSKLEISFE